jgi:two-component system sensor histidine kinase HydH
MRSVSDKKRKKTYLYIVLILAAASLATLVSTAIIYRNSLHAVEGSLRLQALGIAASLEPSLQTIKGKERLLPDIVTEAAWEGIAYIALYDRDGRTLLHSNMELVGRRSDLPELKAAVNENRPTSGYVTLGTGENVFALNYPIHSGKTTKVLRIALHPYPAEDIIRQAGFQAISIMIIVVVLWIIGFFLIRAVKRSDELSVKMAQKEHLAVIGEMAAVLAHEIRNPIGSIKGFAQYLSEHKTENRAEFDIIINEAGRLERLTEDLLSYARPSDVRVREFNLAELVNETLGLIQESDRIKQLNISTAATIPDALTISTDREKLKQVLVNLVENAVDAVTKNGSVELWAEKTDNKIIIAVNDNGCGMDDTMKARAFESFFTTKAKGTGLGLAIVGRLVMAIGGEIDMRSVEEKGTLFTISLPVEYRAGHEQG